jgi:hypothetical protein
MDIVAKEKTVAHPLEDVFGIEVGTTVAEYREVVPVELTPAIDYDDKDNEIEGNLEEIYNTAMGQVLNIADTMDMVEGKYKARVGEVTATMLSVALGATRERRMMKEHKDKLTPNKNAGTVNNTLIMGDSVLADRNELLRAFMAPVIDSK